jgi:hypothetical protein
MSLINNIIKDERIAPTEYKKLLKNKRLNKSEKKQIRAIIKQERQHYKKIKKMRRRMK